MRSVYICIRPLDSTEQPPRSQLADSFLPTMTSGSKHDMIKHYTLLLTAILEQVASFFSNHKGKRIKDHLALWNNYSLQIDDADSRFPADVCRIVSADQSGAKRRSVRNDRVTPNDDNIDEKRGKRTMTEKARWTKQSHEDGSVPLASRISSRSSPNSSLATRIERRSNEISRNNSLIVDKHKK